MWKTMCVLLDYATSYVYVLPSLRNVTFRWFKHLLYLWKSIIEIILYVFFMD